MQNYRKTSHTTYDCKYHIVWITKYRKRVLTGLITEWVRELIRGICKEQEVEILKGHISSDHIHLFLSVPPHLAVSKLVQYLKGKSSYKMLQEDKQLSKLYWGRHLWGSVKIQMQSVFFCRHVYQIKIRCNFQRKYIF